MSVWWVLLEGGSVCIIGGGVSVGRLHGSVTPFFTYFSSEWRR